ncbi:MAG TPA: glycoside hydrolase family 38 C-terminal domain-containing protein, partial [Thermomicrobiaceae bacterium]|nr:glycoside hydrolase family 38 C-terminal domain-containing protein [Thermomicrobiaceae bacterium]
PAAEPEQAGRRHLLWECDGETTAWLDGQPWAGLDAAHPTCPLPDRSCTLWLDCGLWESVGGEPRRPIGPYGPRFDQCRLLVRDELAWSTHHDLDVLEQLRAVLFRQEGLATAGAGAYVPPLESCSPLLRLLLGELDLACDAWVRGGLPALAEALRELFARLPAEAWQPVAALCGHAHIDLVWLWPEGVTERKAVHSFATVLRLMERYPELTFVGSQPALYRKVEQAAPSQLREIAARIAEGRWQIAGAFEVEPDTNLPSGEGLVRALVYGQRKIAALTGAPSDVCWLPDSFGYSASLPQILALGGVRSFFTTKLTWSQITRFPYTSFVWRGPDGSAVLAHVCPTTYNGSVELEGIVDAMRVDRQLDVHPEVLLPTGWGDGGGGPTEAMCERARRIRSLSGIPRARWDTADRFFDSLAAVRDRLPVYQGELYLEYHRGTLTTQSEHKRLYRAAERALQAHEAVRVATGGGPLGEDAWLRALFAQFHDALPGSSIRRVYAELNPELEAIARRELSAATAELRRGGSGLMAFNPAPLPRTVVLESPEPRLVRCGPLEGVALGRQADDAAPLREISPAVLDNGIVRATFDRAGQLDGLTVDGQPLELAAPCGFVLYHDQPAHFDAWDIDHYSVRTGVPLAERLALQVAERGPLRGVLRGGVALGERSRLSLSYVLEAESRWLRLEVEVDWHESHRLLRYHVPTRYQGRFARYGSPFGSTLRSQWPGTPADEALWEVAGSRWAAVTNDDGVGLALLTEAKFGFSCRDGDLAVSLLRAPKSPDPEADMGRHRIRLALGRHEPRTRGEILCSAAAADALFAPVLIAEGEGVLAPPFVLEDAGSLVPSWVLPATGGDGFVLRLHETDGGAGTARLRLARPCAAQLVDLLERPLAALASPDGLVFEVPYRPYQIVSVKVS